MTAIISRQHSWCALAPMLALAFAGCQAQDDGIYHLTGKVTHRGAPVPAGFVFFEPDSARQNRGPQGYALIEAGQYTTRGDYGKGVVGGPYRVRIGGFDGQEINETQPYGRRLFPDYLQKAELPRVDSEVDWEVP